MIIRKNSLSKNDSIANGKQKVTSNILFTYFFYGSFPGESPLFIIKSSMPRSHGRPAHILSLFQ